MNIYTLAFGMPGMVEWVIIGVIALLIFGRRLPDVARSVGKSIVEFKKGIRDVKDDINHQSKIESSSNNNAIEDKSNSNSNASNSDSSNSNASNSGASNSNASNSS